MKKIVEQLEEEARGRIGEGKWQIFQLGDDQEWERVREEVETALSAQ